MKLKNKHIVITQLRLFDYAGSEMVTLEVCREFARRGAKVSVVTQGYDRDAAIAKEILATDGVDLFWYGDPRFDEFYKNKPADLVWVHHQMIPHVVLDDLDKHRPKFIFNHMSSRAPIETPIFYEIQNSLADLITYNSHENMDEQQEQGFFAGDRRRLVFPNPAPDEFYRQKTEIKSQPETITIVSNHEPEDVAAAITKLEKRGIKVIGRGRSYGSDEKPNSEIKPEDIFNTDAVITIGKTVQYSIMAKTPAYVYDHFGGPGYLDSKNYENVKYHNFSGRGKFMKTKSPDQIVSEIIDRYSDAKKFIDKTSEKEKKYFSLSENIDIVLKKAFSSTRSDKPSAANIIGYKETSPSLIRELGRSVTETSEEETLKDYRRLVSKYRGGVDEVNSRIEDLENENQALRSEIHAIVNSQTHKMGRLVSLPVRAVKKANRILRAKARLLRMEAEVFKSIKNTYGEIDLGDLKVDVIIRSYHHPTSSTFIRLLSPLTYGKLGKKLNIKLINGENNPKPRPDADIVIVQRTPLKTLDQAKDLYSKIKSNNQKLIIDTDDAFGGLEESHPQYEEQYNRVEALKFLIDMADQVWFSTEDLRNSYDIDKKKAVVVKNTIDDRVWSNYKKQRKSKKLKIVYMGTTTHSEDFNMIVPALKRLNEKYAGKFTLSVIGVAKGLEKYDWVEVLKQDSALYPEFVKWFSNQGPFDIGLAPLVDNEFNRSKSDIKCLDYFAIGVEPVVSNVEAYSGSDLDGLITRVSNTERGWFEAIETKIKQYTDDSKFNPETRRKRAFEYVKKHRSTEVSSEQIHNSLKQLTNKGE